MMNPDPQDPDTARPFRTTGIVLIVLGVAALLFPVFATIAVEQLVAWLLVLAGATGIAMWWRFRDLHRTGWISLGLAVLCVILGVLLLFDPIAGARTLTIILGLAFLAEAALTLLFAMAVRTRLKGGVWMMLSGLTSLVMAVLIFSGWPGTAVWVIGLLFGINLLTSGLALMFLRVHPGTLP